MITQSKTKQREESPRTLRQPKHRSISRPFPPGFTPVIHVTSVPKDTFDGNRTFSPVFLSPSLRSPLPPPEKKSPATSPERSATEASSPIHSLLQLPARTRSKAPPSSAEALKSPSRSPGTPGSLKKLCHSLLSRSQDVPPVPSIPPSMASATSMPSAISMASANSTSFATSMSSAASRDFECGRPSCEKPSKSRLRTRSQHAYTPKSKTRYHHTPYNSTGAVLESSFPTLPTKQASLPSKLQKTKSVGDLRGEKVKLQIKENFSQSGDLKERTPAAKVQKNQCSGGMWGEGVKSPTNERHLGKDRSREYFKPCTGAQIKSSPQSRSEMKSEGYAIDKPSKTKIEEGLDESSILSNWADWKEDVVTLNYLPISHRFACMT